MASAARSYDAPPPRRDADGKVPWTRSPSAHDALEAYSKSLEIKIKVVGQDHRDVADTKYNMASLHKKRGERDVARQLFLECEIVYAKVYGLDHSKTKEAAQQARGCE